MCVCECMMIRCVLCGWDEGECESVCGEEEGCGDKGSDRGKGSVDKKKRRNEVHNRVFLRTVSTRFSHHTD